MWKKFPMYVSREEKRLLACIHLAAVADAFLFFVTLGQGQSRLREKVLFSKWADWVTNPE